MKKYKILDQIYKDNEYNTIYRKTFDDIITGKTYFSGNNEEMVGKISGLYEIPIKRNIIKSDNLKINSNNKIIIPIDGLYIVSGKVYVSANASGIYNLAVRKNDAVSLSECVGYSVGFPTNMDGVEYIEGKGYIYGDSASMISTYSISKLEKGDEIYMTLQNTESRQSRICRYGGLDLVLIQ